MSISFNPHESGVKQNSAESIYHRKNLVVQNPMIREFWTSPQKWAKNRQKMAFYGRHKWNNDEMLSEPQSEGCAGTDATFRLRLWFYFSETSRHGKDRL